MVHFYGTLLGYTFSVHFSFKRPQLPRYGGLVIYIMDHGGNNTRDIDIAGRPAWRCDCGVGRVSSAHQAAGLLVILPSYTAGRTRTVTTRRRRVKSSSALWCTAAVAAISTQCCSRLSFSAGSQTTPVVTGLHQRPPSHRTDCDCVSMGGKVML